MTIIFNVLMLCIIVNKSELSSVINVCTVSVIFTTLSLISPYRSPLNQKKKKNGITITNSAIKITNFLGLG